MHFSALWMHFSKAADRNPSDVLNVEMADMDRRAVDCDADTSPLRIIRCIVRFTRYMAARSSTWHLVSLYWVERICYACLPTREYFVLIALVVLLKPLMTPWWHSDKTGWPLVINPRRHLAAFRFHIITLFILSQYSTIYHSALDSWTQTTCMYTEESVKMSFFLDALASLQVSLVSQWVSH